MANKVQFTEAERNAIQDAASRILAHPSFRSSERSSRLFRYLLDHALLGEGESLKERHIGHEVFGREISYDTAIDPVVRNAASETRKRLRQYTAESGSNGPVRILLEPGSYALNFLFTPVNEQAESPEFEPPTSSATPNPPITSVLPLFTPLAKPPIWKRLTFAYAVALIALVCCVILAIALHRYQGRQMGRTAGADATDPLWTPMLSSGKEVFISLGHAERLAPSDTAVALTSGGLQRITMTDLKAYTNISGFLQLNSHPFQMRTDTETTLLDLRDRPVVLIGIHNNGWTLRLNSKLRYRFDFGELDEGKPNGVVTIIDSQHPERRLWQVPVDRSSADAVDYAVAGRLLDPVTGGLVLYVAGAGPVGTQAASEFVTQLGFLRGLPESLRSAKTNFEVVLKTPIVGGVPGSPEVLATDIQ
jgi:hypothetical protein